MFIMQDHLLSVHPFVVCSKIEGVHGYLQEQGQELENRKGAETEHTHDTTVEVTVSLCPTDIKTFIVVGNGKMGAVVFSAKLAGNN